MSVEGFDRTPPYSGDAEAAVLGACLMDVNALIETVEVIPETAFYFESNRRAFRAMVRLWERAVPIDATTMIEELRNTGELEAVGGIDFLSRLVGSVTTSANVSYHARIVRDKAMLRRLIEAASTAIRDAYDIGERSPAEVVALAEEKILAVASGTSDRSYRWAKELLWEVFEEIEKRQELDGETPGLSTGLGSLDRKTLGLHKGELTVIAARPSVGKTAAATQVGWHVAIEESTPVLIFSFEMTAKELMTRAIASEGRVDLYALRGGRKLLHEEHERMATAMGVLNTAKMFIDDSRDAHITAVSARARRAKHQDGIGLIIIDYMQLMDGNGDGRREQIEHISRRLKGLALELDVPVIALSQLSRGPENRTSKRPILSDLRDSGAIEQDADNVWMLFRPEYYMTEAEIRKAKGALKDPTGVAEIIIPKQRNGATGSVGCRFEKSITRFSDLPQAGVGGFS